jgi:hypothetical protein
MPDPVLGARGRAWPPRGGNGGRRASIRGPPAVPFHRAPGSLVGWAGEKERGALVGGEMGERG